MKAKAIVPIFTALLVGLLCGCSSTKFSTTKGVDINGYKYVFLPEAVNDVYGVQEELSASFREAGLVVIENGRTQTIPPRELIYALDCRWSYSGTAEAATVKIFLNDPFASKTVYSGEGMFGMGMNIKGDALGAARRAASGVKSIYTGFNPAVVSKPESEKIRTSEEEAKKYLTAHKPELMPIEGIWIEANNLYRIAIVKEQDNSRRSDRDIVGIVLSSKHPYWESGDVKLTGKFLANKKLCVLQYYLGNKTAIGASVMVEGGVFSFKFPMNDGHEETVTFLREFPELTSDKNESPSTKTGQLPEFSGTGFFISEDGFFVTNDHVVKGGTKISIVTSAGEIPAKVVKVDAANDLALLKAEGRFASLPILPSRGVKLGGTVATVGFPNIGLQGFAPKLAKGEIASLSGAADDARYFQISVPVQPGNSGGALVDERGNVVGVVSAKLNASAALKSSGALPENVNYAVKSSYLLSFLESVPEVSAKLKEPSIKDKKFEDVVKEAEQAAVLVLVY